MRIFDELENKYLNSENEISDKSNYHMYVHNEDPTLEKERYLFSPLIFAAFLMISFPYWTFMEDLVGIKNKPNSFLYNNFMYISTLVITPLVYLFYRKIIRINDIGLLKKWEKENPDYKRVYWMDPLELHQHLSLRGKLLAIFINTGALSIIIIYSSVSIAFTAVYFIFDSNLELIMIIISLFANILLVGQLYMTWDKVISARGWYLFDGYLISRTALIFRSLPDGKIKPKKLDDMYIKEDLSFQYDVPIFQLRTSRSNWWGKIIAYSDDYNKIDEFKNSIQEYFQNRLIEN